MANIQKRDNGSWRARYRDSAGKEHARHFSRRADAQRWLDEVTASVVTGRYVDPKAGKITFAQWFERWASAQVWATGTKLKAAMTIPTPEQLGEALKVAPDFFAPFISVCAFAGLRLGEAAGLQLGDVDFLRRTISVSRQIQGSTKTEAEVVPPKHGDRSGLFSWRKN